MLTWLIVIGFVVLMAWPLVGKILSLRRDLKTRADLIQQQAAQRPPAGPPPAIDDRPLLGKRDGE
jgi:hypothetical protein